MKRTTCAQQLTWRKVILIPLSSLKSFLLTEKIPIPYSENCPNCSHLWSQLLRRQIHCSWKSPVSDWSLSVSCYTQLMDSDVLLFRWSSPLSLVYFLWKPWILKRVCVLSFIRSGMNNNTVAYPQTCIHAQAHWNPRQPACTQNHNKMWHSCSR